MSSMVKGNDFQVVYQNEIWNTSKRIARGGFSKVFELSNADLSAPLAYKRALRKGIGNDDQFEKLFLTEYKCGLMLRHSGVVRVLDCRMSLHRDHYYLLMELYQGDLYEELEKNEEPFSLEIVRCYLKQIAEALAYIHSKRIAHRDIKLENILVNGMLSFTHEHKRLIISDFGLSKINSNLGFTRVGTRYTMAPEVLASQGGYDVYKADSWSVGIVLFILLHSHKPYDTEDSEQQLFHEVNHHWENEVNPALPIYFLKLLSSLLHFSPKSRLTMEELLHQKVLQRHCDLS